MAATTRPNTVSFAIPLTPPSVNHYVRHTRFGRHYVTEAARSFKDAIAIFACGQMCTAKEYQVTITVYLGKGQKLDCDNMAKLVLDGLVDARVISSDAKVMLLVLEKFRDPGNPRTEITVEAYGILKKAAKA